MIQVAEKVWNGLTQGIDEDKTIISLQGSSRSAKTYNVLIFLIAYLLQHANTRLSIVRKTLPAIKGSVLIDFKEILYKLGVWQDKDFNKTELIYKFPNGSWVEFFSTDNEQKIRGRKRHILFVNEANEITLLEWQQLKMRTTQFSIIDYNPSFSEDHWIETENQDKDTYHFISTYKDNPFLEQKIIDDIEKLRDKNKSLWTVYGLGQRAVIEGRIFDSYEIVESIPFHVHWKRIGQDLGYSSDPTAIVAVYIFEDILYLDELCYRTRMLTNDIIKVLKDECSNEKIISESADPRLIDEIYNAGVNIHAVEKGAGSIKAGLTKMKEYKIKITKRSTNLKKELDNYVYAQDKEGKYLNEPIDSYNHCFTGETLIKTNNGFRRIDEIKVSELVLTSKGYKSVNKVYLNGFKKICIIKLIFSTFAVNIRATPDHKFKTAKGWKKLSQLTKGDVLFTLPSYLEDQAKREQALKDKSLMEKPFTSIKMKGIFQKAPKGCIAMFGNFTTGIFRKGTKCTIKTLTRITTISQILNAYWLKSIRRSTTKVQVLPTKRINNSSIFPLSGTKQRSGTQAKKAVNGIRSTENRLRQIGRLKNMFVKYVVKNFIQKDKTKINSVQTTVRHNSEDCRELTMKQEYAKDAEKNLSATSTPKFGIVESNALEGIQLISVSEQEVYDLEVTEQHEYFANGVLVHNCMDATRYVILSEVLGRNKKYLDINQIAAMF